MYYKAFENNPDAMELARILKMRPRTIHINVVYHHFRENVRRREIIIHPISTVDQVVGIFTKLLAQNLFVKHRTTLLHWSTHIHCRAPNT